MKAKIFFEHGQAMLPRPVCLNGTARRNWIVEIDDYRGVPARVGLPGDKARAEPHPGGR